MEVLHPTPQEKELYNDLKKYYKYVYRCIQCSVIYGSDMPFDNYICPACSVISSNTKRRAGRNHGNENLPAL